MAPARQLYPFYLWNEANYEKETQVSHSSPDFPYITDVKLALLRFVAVPTGEKSNQDELCPRKRLKKKLLSPNFHDKVDKIDKSKSPPFSLGNS